MFSQVAVNRKEIRPCEKTDWEFGGENKNKMFAVKRGEGVNVFLHNVQLPMN
jgi:hypothetical protein